MWTILSICDDIDFSRQLVVAATEVGCTVVGAEGPDDGIERARQGQFDAIVLWTEVSQDSWLEVLRELRQSHPAGALVALRRLSTESVALEALRAGADDVIDPDLSTSEILRRAATLCTLRRGPGSAVRRAEGRLRAAEARYRTLVESAPYGVAIVQRGGITYVNPTGARITGMARGDLEGKDVKEIVSNVGGVASPDLGPRLAEALTEPVSGEVKVSLKKDREILLTYSSVVTEFDGIPSILVMFADVSDRFVFQRQEERRRVELEELRKLAENLSSTLDFSRVVSTGCERLLELARLDVCAIYVRDEENGTLELAGGFRSDDASVVLPVRLDWDPSEEPTTPPVVDVDTDTSGLPEDFLAANQSMGIGSCVLVPLWGHDRLVGVIEGGRRRDNDFDSPEIRLLCAAATSVGMAIENSRLYADLRASYSRILDTQAELVRKERLAALGELSATVAHEVRNPLAAIYNSLSQLKRMVPEGDATVLLEIAQEEATRLNRIIGDLLQFARPGAPDLRAVPLDDVVESAVRAARQDGANREDVEITVSPVTADIMARCDSSQLRQALVNLLVNAFQAMDAPGKIEVNAQVAWSEDLVELIVQDTGPGMAPDVIERAFDPFFTTRPTGSGLGLAIVRRILEDQHGSVQVESEPGRGARFVMRLPRALSN